MRRRTHKALSLVLAFGIVSCAGPRPGPDKQGAGLLRGAATGAGAGAITGFQVGAGTGPGAVVGAGFGAVAGSIAGFVQDRVEDNLLVLSAQIQQERARGYAHEVLADHYRRRMELHPTRDIFPADVFFKGDDVKLRAEAKAVIREIARLNENRLPWSRFVIASYIRSSDEDGSNYARYLAGERAKAISNVFVNAGLEPRRMVPQAIVIDAPLVIDPHDDPLRYNQAIEFIPVDR